YDAYIGRSVYNIKSLALTLSFPQSFKDAATEHSVKCSRKFKHPEYYDIPKPTLFSPRTPWPRETLSRDPHPRHPKFRPDIHIFYLELSVSHTHTHTLPYTCLHIMSHHLYTRTCCNLFCL